MRRVPLSRNFPGLLSRSRPGHCKYCAFANHPAHLYAPGEVERGVADEAPAGAARHDPRGRRAQDPVHERDPGRNRGVTRGSNRLAGSSRGGQPRVRPHPRGDPAVIAEAAQAGSQITDHRSQVPLPAWALPISLDDMRVLVREAQRILPGVGIQIPPNLSDWWLPLVEEGATDLGGLSPNGDHISPEHPFPSVHRMRKELAPRGYALTERLCVYPQYMDPEWLEQGVLDVIKLKYWSFIPRRGSGRREERVIKNDLVPAAIEKGREGIALTKDELTAMFAETRPEAIEDMRQAADELREELAGELVTFVVNRNINVSNVCIVGCAFCGFGQGKRSPDAYEHSREEFARRVADALEFGATEICMQSGIHPDWTLEDYEGWLRFAKELAPDIHMHAYSPMKVAYMCDTSGLSPRVVFERLGEAGPGPTPGTAPAGPDDGGGGRDSPKKPP